MPMESTPLMSSNRPKQLWFGISPMEPGRTKHGMKRLGAKKHGMSNTTKVLYGKRSNTSPTDRSKQPSSMPRKVLLSFKKRMNLVAVPPAGYTDQSGVWYPGAEPVRQAGTLMLPAPGVPGGRIPVSPPAPTVERKYGGKGQATMAVAIREVVPQQSGNDEVFTQEELDYCSGIAL